MSFSPPCSACGSVSPWQPVFLENQDGRQDRGFLAEWGRHPIPVPLVLPGRAHVIICGCLSARPAPRHTFFFNNFNLYWFSSINNIQLGTHDPCIQSYKTIRERRNEEQVKYLSNAFNFNKILNLHSARSCVSIYYVSKKKQGPQLSIRLCVLNVVWPVTVEKVNFLRKSLLSSKGPFSQECS